MNILVIGGLGYLGYALCQQLSDNKSVKDIHILDCNMFGKFGERDYSHYIMHHMNLGDEDIKESDFNFIKKDKIDKIIYCFTPNEKMLSNRSMHNYNERILSNLIKIKNQTPKKACVTLITDLNANEATADFEREIKREISDSPISNIIPCPSLFGVSGAFDSSTFINRMILDFITQKYYYLEGDPFETVSFKGIYHTAQEIVGIVVNKPYKENMETNCLPKIMIANAVNTLFGFEEHQLHMDIGSRRNFNIAGDNLKYVDHKELEHFKMELEAGIAKGIMLELLEEKYNNELQIDNILKSCPFAKLITLIQG